MTNRKSSSAKVIAVGTSDGPHAALSLPGDGNTENVEALIPMISDHFIDAKVSNRESGVTATVTSFTFTKR